MFLFFLLQSALGHSKTQCNSILDARLVFPTFNPIRGFTCEYKWKPDTPIILSPGFWYNGCPPTIKRPRSHGRDDARKTSHENLTFLLHHVFFLFFLFFPPSMRNKRAHSSGEDPPLQHFSSSQKVINYPINIMKKNKYKSLETSDYPFFSSDQTIECGINDSGGCSKVSADFSERGEY